MEKENKGGDINKTENELQDGLENSLSIHNWALEPEPIGEA